MYFRQGVDDKLCFFLRSLKVTLKISYQSKDVSYIDGYWIIRIVFSGGSKGGDVNPKGGDANLLLSPANEVCEGYVFTGVCLSTGDVCPIACWDTPQDQRQTPPSPEADTPLGRHHLPE